jgi:hypothetical protein
MTRPATRDAGHTALVALAIGCGAFATWFAIRYASQLPLDQYAFRQSQTVLTAYWLQRNGFSLAYETPVVGPPWSIPFEFPIWQWIVAVLSTWTGASLEATGRLVSFGFLLGCLPPVRTIAKRLRLSPAVFPVFCALVLSSPTYVYWGRALMIETAALFFCVVAIRWFVDLLLGIEARRAAMFFAVFLSAGMLQKATTAVPILAVLGLIFVAQRARRIGSLASFIASREAATAALCFGVPLALGAGWTVYTDRVKLLNPFAATALTTLALHGWNFGTLAQRLSPDLFRDTIWKEILERNCAGIVGIALLILGTLLRSTSHARAIVVVSLTLGILPLFVFTNLHIYHSYFQAENVVFFLFALAVVVGHVLKERLARPAIVPILAAVLVASNLHFFLSQDREGVEARYTFDNSTDVALATVIDANVPPDHYFVAFDLLWSSSLTYLSQRKSFTVSDVFKDYEAMRRDPSKFMDPARLDAVIACPSEPGRVAELFAWSRAGRRWKIGSIDDCYIAVPERQAVVDAAPIPTDCEATAVSIAPIHDRERLVVVRLQAPRRSEDYFVDVASSRVEMLDVSGPGEEPAQYTSLVDTGDPRSIRIDRLRDGRLEQCRITPVPGRDPSRLDQRQGRRSGVQ